MEHQDFIELVREMRLRQKLYFLRREKWVLQECKELEKRVDHAIAEYQNPNKQTALF